MGIVPADVNWSYRIFRVFGIDVRVHVTFILIVGYFAYVWGVLREPGGLGGAMYGVVLVVLLFGLVVIHELTHSRVAQAYGITVRDITLLPIGGMAAMEEMPKEPRQELLVALAGPMSNVVMAVVMAVAAPLVVGTSAFRDLRGFSDAILEPSFAGAYLYLLAVNVSLAVFNLLPAFPMDGGRVFRAFLALRMGRARATRVAVAVGQLMAVLLGILGVFGGGIFLVVVAVFIYFGAQAEGRGDELKGALGDLLVGQAVTRNVDVARPGQTIGELAARLFHTYQTDFPVVEGDGEVVGMVTRDRLIAMLGKHGADFPVMETMRTDFPVGRLADHVYEVFERMQAGGVRAVPVIEDGRLVGMLSLEDITEVIALLNAGGPDLARRVVPEPGEGRLRGGPPR